MSDIDDTQLLIQQFEPLLKGLNYHQLSVLNRLIIERMRLIQKAGTLVSMAQFQVGDRVSWDGKDGSVKTGIIFRINQKTVSIRTRDEGHWNVSPQLLYKQF